MRTKVRTYLINYGALAPFVALGVFGLVTLVAWWTGSVDLLQPRPFDVPLPANAAVCLMLLCGGALAHELGFRRIGHYVFGAIILVAGLTALENLAGSSIGLDDLLVTHRKVIDGSGVARMPLALAASLVVAAAMLIRRSGPGSRDRWPLYAALVGSLLVAYGITALFAARTGLSSIATWVNYARLGPPSAAAIVVLGTGFLTFAGTESARRSETARWLPLPVVVGGVTLSLFFWFALRERELAYINSTTQLTIDNLAALYSAESSAEISNLSRMAERWNQAGGTPQQAWEREAIAQFNDFSAYRALMWVSDSLRTQWLYPRYGNEDYISLDHAADPMRWAAIQSARRNSEAAIAGPIQSPLRSPTFSVYVPVVRGGRPDGFMVGDIYYDRLFDTVTKRIDLPSRYSIRVTVDDAAHHGAGDSAELVIYEINGAAIGEAGRLMQSATYNLHGQRVTITLAPHAEQGTSTRQFLPELALISGLGVSLLIGLVVNLTQTAHQRRRAAESTSRQLRIENEERRRVEAQLKVTDERLNLALSSTLVGVYEWDVRTGSAFYSPSVWISIGYDPTAMPATAKGWEDLIHPDDLPAYRAAFESHFRGETAFIEPEYRVRSGGAEWAWVAARAKCVSFSPAGEPLRVIGTCQNITDRKKAEEALRASQAAARMLSHVASRTENPVVITSAGGAIEWTNDSFCRLTGRTLEAVRGTLLIELLASPDEEPAALDRVTQALVRGEAVTTDVIAVGQPDNRRYHLRLELQPVRNEYGVLENFIVLAADITARVQTETELRRAKAEADAASRAKSDFQASMSHEIRTPMNGVIGMTSLLLETELTPEQRDYVSTIRTSGDALLAVINEILDFSKIESGKMELEQQPFELAQCLEEALDIFALQAAAKNIELAYYIDPAVPPWIEGDMTRLRQVLVNLVNNAVKFTSQGQITVEVHVATVEVRPGSHIVHEESGRLLLDFYVADSGIGIPEDRLGLLFKPFSQVDSSTTRKFGGTGLGLAICDRLCHLMGGSIDVTSKPGEGSTFRFSIQARPAPPVVEDIVPQIPESAHGKAILIIDDLAINRAILSRVVSTLGFTPLATHNHFNAVELALENKIAAAIVDQELEGESGLDLAKEMRTRFPQLPILLLISPIETAKRIDSADPSLIRVPKPIKPSSIRQLLSSFFTDNSTRPPQPESSETPVLAASIPIEILLVEDNPVNQKVALRFLSRLGYRADAVGNGLEAFHTLQQRNYDLVFMDVQMPEMDGFTATREIRKHLPVDRQPRIVALTANAVQGDRERCLAAGMDDYISKPVRIEALQQVIERFFSPNSG